MVSVCLPSDALLQHLPSYLDFSYLGCGVSLYSCSSKAQPLLLTLDEGYLLMATPPDLEHGVAPLSPPCTAAAPWRWGCSSHLCLAFINRYSFLFKFTVSFCIVHFPSTQLYARIQTNTYTQICTHMTSEDSGRQSRLQGTV